MLDFNVDHVIVDYWNGEHWIFVDAQLQSGPEWRPFDTCNIPRLIGAAKPAAPSASPSAARYFETAAQVWTGYRRGEIDADRYGVAPDLPWRGREFVQNEVLIELVHRQRDELLVWDKWGAMRENRTLASAW